jgi:hypothetical protein
MSLAGNDHGEGTMTDDPKEYLQRALECARLSQKAADVKARDTLAAMVKTWVRLSDIEQAQALVDEWDYPVREKKTA